MTAPFACDIHGTPKQLCAVHGCGDCCADEAAFALLNAGASVVYSKEPEPND